MFQWQVAQLLSGFEWGGRCSSSGGCDPWDHIAAFSLSLLLKGKQHNASQAGVGHKPPVLGTLPLINNSLQAASQDQLARPKMELLSLQLALKGLFYSKMQFLTHIPIHYLSISPIHSSALIDQATCIQKHTSMHHNSTVYYLWKAYTPSLCL